MNPRANRRTRALGLLCVLLAVGATHAHAAPTKGQAATCIAAAEQAQDDRLAGRLVSARAALLRCTPDACPGAVRSDCRRWLEEVSTELPTALISVVDPAGKDVVGALVRVDGRDVGATPLAPVPIDPGHHTIATDTDKARAEIVLRVGERGRPVVLALPRVPTPAISVAPPPVQTAPAQPRGRLLPFDPLTTGLLAVSAVATGSFVYLGWTGRSRANFLRDTCAPSCNADAVSSARWRLRTADVSLGVGVLSAAAAAYRIFHPTRAGEAAMVPTRAGATLFWSGQF